MHCVICGKDLSGHPVMRDNVTGILYCSQHSSYMDAINAGTISACPACGFRYSQADSSFPNAACPTCGAPLSVKAAQPEEMKPIPGGADVDLGPGSVPSRDEVVEKLRGLIGGDLDRRDVSQWASKWVAAMDVSVEVGKALAYLSVCAAPGARGYLYEEEDFRAWLGELTT